ncbi:hypothetical protein BT93_G2177 [Corymbia citriodora subsp. variegata]|nr:hypothetical protein BT93_G2177 [Corymbia citriodora subsp. variegata]
MCASSEEKNSREDTEGHLEIFLTMSSVTPCHGGNRTVKYTKSYSKNYPKKSKKYEQKNNAQGDQIAPSLSVTLKNVTKKKAKDIGVGKK